MANYQWRRRGTIHKNSHTGAKNDTKKEGNEFPRFPQKCSIICGLLFLENVLAHAADGALPALGDLFPGGAGGDAVVGVTYRGVVDVAAGADILVHLEALQ